jgi:type III pantothenate kinase
MLLLVDAGNSRIKWNVMTEGTGYLGGKTKILDWSNVSLETFFDSEWKSLTDISRVLVSNVVGEDFSKALKKWVTNNWFISTEFITPTSTAFGVSCGYDKPNQLGVDRWLSLIAAKTISKDEAVCVIDCGTALTFDTLSNQGKHLGGLIVPGLDMMRKSLIKETRGINVRSKETKVTLFGKNTMSCVNSGYIYSIVATIDRVAEEVRKKSSSNVRCIITGGNASMLQPLFKEKYQHEPDLVLLGLGRVAGQIQ